MEYKKKLIEVALPLEKINESAAHEKMPGIGPHPRGIHLWWARRPFTAARAVIFSSLVDDPSSHPELFPTEADQDKERQRLFGLIEELVGCDLSNNSDIINRAKTEIMRSTDNNPPALLDPFSGGGAIPFEAHRLGLEAHAHDLNPVAVMINKAMIEIPPVFSNHAPINPESRRSIGGDNPLDGIHGLAADVKYYGEWIKTEAFKKVGHLYPKIKVPKEQGGGEATAVAWIWARTVKCPNPACGCQIPLANSFELSKKKGKSAWIVPIYDKETNSIRYFVKTGNGKAPDSPKISKGKFKCIICGQPIDPQYIKNVYQSHNGGRQLIAVVANKDGSKKNSGKLYLTPDVEQILASNVPKPENFPSGVLTGKAADGVSSYGMSETADLFTNRQLSTLTELSMLIQKAKEKAELDAVQCGMQNDHISLSAGGTGAKAYSEAISVYLTFAIDRVADFSTSVSRWAVTNEKAMNCFSKQAIAMTWDYPEVNIFGDCVGSFSTIIDYVVDCINTLNTGNAIGIATQADAQTDCGLRNIMISTDPPYYDNICYADLSDFFYVWMRQGLKDIYPDLFNTIMVPKNEELVASPYRFKGRAEEAKSFFEDGMFLTCKQIYKYVRDDIPVTIYYAYKQSETEEQDGESQTASGGWETMLSAIIQAGFTITGTWPMRTEQAYRTVSMGTNALACSIVLVCRKRPDNAPQITKKNLVNALRKELHPALKRLQTSNIAPVDLAQSAIGPGMGVFSQYSCVLEANGTPMTVRSALQIINEEIDLYFNEQEGSIDTASRFCIDLYTQCAYNNIKYGEAEVLANAKAASIPAMVSHGILFAKTGIVHLVERENLPKNIDTNESNIWLLTQQLTKTMSIGGVEACAQAISKLYGSNIEKAKDLAYRLYTIAERKGWANEAYAYNSLVVAWPDIQTRAAELKQVKPEQLTLFDTQE